MPLFFFIKIMKAGRRLNEVLDFLTVRVDFDYLCVCVYLFVLRDLGLLLLLVRR